jgi:hypothetical protein
MTRKQKIQECCCCDSCIECQKQLAQCKEAKCKQCEEDKKGAFVLINKLEKKVLALTIVVVIAITLIGKELADEIVNSLSAFESVQEKANSVLETEEKGETREVSINDTNSSQTFSQS